jgi:Recombination protein O N terminal
MYTTYTTEAFVCSREAVGEGDFQILLFTREFGLLYARAAGVRKESSKLRYSLSTEGCLSVSLVRGVRGWRLVGAESCGGGEASSIAGGPRFYRVLTLVVKLLALGEPDQGIFSIVSVHGWHALQEEDELACVASILSLLGFMKDSPEGDACAWWKDFARRDKNAVLTSVNTALSLNHIVR